MSDTSIRVRSVAAAISALATAAAVHGQARVIYVDASNTGAHSGASWQTAFRDLQDALYAAQNDPNRPAWGVEIRVSQGVYTPDRGTLSPSASFVLNSAVTLMGGFAGLLGADPDQRDPKRFVSVLSGDLNHDDTDNFGGYDENSRTIVRGAYDTTIDGFEISGGNADPTVYPYVQTPGVVYAVGLGGEASQTANLTIRNCSIVRNRAIGVPVVRLYWGSGVFSSRINGNRTIDGHIVRAVGTRFQSAEVRGNRLIAGPSSSGNACIWFAPSSISSTVEVLHRCLIADNVGGSLGAVFCSDANSYLVLRGCTVANNSAPWSEAITCPVNAVTLQSCIVAGNVRTSTPTAYTQIYAPSASAINVDATVLIDNGVAGVRFVSAGGPPPPFLSGDARFVSAAGPDHSPLTWADNDYHPRPDSPAVDRAPSLEFYPDYVDLDGRPPFDVPGVANLGTGVYPYIDLGAYESDGSLCAADFNASGTLTVGDIFDFLNAWLGSSASADFDRSGTLTVSDIFAFLNAWLAGC